MKSIQNGMICLLFLGILPLMNCGSDNGVNEPMNQAPIASASAEGEMGDFLLNHDIFLLGGSSSDPDGDVLTYLWEFVSIPDGSASTIANATASQAAFIPDDIGDYVVKLTVSDGELSDEAELIISVSPPDLITNLIITNSTGLELQGPVGSMVVIETSNYLNTPDGDTPLGPTGDPLIFTFEFVSTPAGSNAIFEDPDAGEAGQKVFTMDKPGSYEIKVTVTDGTQTATDAKTVITQAPANISFDPIFGKPGGTIIISGDYMSPIATDNIVKINGVTATVLSASDGANPSLTVELPSGFTTGNISVELGTDEVISDDPFYAYPNVTVSTFAGSTLGNTDATGTSAQFNNPFGIVYHGSNDELYVVDQGNNTIRKITSDAVVSTFAGDGTESFQDGVGTNAQFDDPQGIALNTSGSTLYIADAENNRVRTISIGTANVSTLAGDGTDADVDGTGTGAQFALYIHGLAVDDNANLFVSNTGTHVIRKIDGSGVVSTFAGNSGMSGDDDATGSAARFNMPSGMAIDSDNNIYVSDSDNHSIRKITSDAMVSTISGTGIDMTVDGVGGQYNFPSGLLLDEANGILYIAEFQGNVIRQYIIEANLVLTIAGSAGDAANIDGDGETARFNGPVAMAMDAEGSIYVTDYNNHTIRKITFN